jgi:hypothetical protein
LNITVRNFILQIIQYSQGYTNQHNLILTTKVEKYENVFFHTFFLYELPVNIVLLYTHFRTVSYAIYCVRHTYFWLYPHLQLLVFHFILPVLCYWFQSSSHETIEEPLNWLLRNLMLEIFKEGCHLSQFWLLSAKNNGHFTWRSTWKFYVALTVHRR